MGGHQNKFYTMAALRAISLGEKSLLKQGLKVAAASASCPVSPCHQKSQVRNLSVHECISMKILDDAGVPVPKFGIATSSAEARKIAEDLNSKDLVIKAQVLAGGRGKGRFANYPKGGVQLLFSAEEIEEAAKGMIGDFLITKQTGKEGRICNSVLVTERKYTRKEYYVAFTNERSFGGPVMVASAEGGVNIEDVAASNPEAILKFAIDIHTGLTKEKAVEIADALHIPKADQDAVADTFIRLYNIFQTKDATMVEINPFAEDVSGKYFCLDAKIKFDLNYIALDGDIGCMVNGAGLAMATMDIIKL